MSATRTKAEAAAALGVSVDTIDRLRVRGQIASVVIGKSVRIPQSEIDRLLTPRPKTAA